MIKYLMPLWVALLALSGGIGLWFSGIALKEIWHYTALDRSAPALVSAWTVSENTPSKYTLEASYEYSVEGKEYYGKTNFKSPVYFNRFAAEHEIKAEKMQSWEVWYRKKNPTYSTLDRHFPFKPCVHAVLTIGIFVYFFLSRRLVTRCFT